MFLGLHAEITPSDFLDTLRKKGLPLADTLPGRDPDVARQMLTQAKQLGLILESTLAGLSPPAITALRFAALLPPDGVPWPWLRALTVACHPEVGEKDELGVDSWLGLQRRLTGLRLLTSGDHPELARIHRLVAGHLIVGSSNQPVPGPEVPPGPGFTPAQGSFTGPLLAHLTARACSIYETEQAPADWELDALLVALPLWLPDQTPSSAAQTEGRPLSDFLEIANASVFLCDKVSNYRSLPSAAGLISRAHRVIQRLAAADPSNAGWQRDLFVSYWRMADMAEKSGTGDAIGWWRKAYDQLAGMKQRGVMVPTDEQYLPVLKGKFQR